MRKITRAQLYKRFIVTIVCIMGLSLHSFGQCPTITIPVQSFCDIDVPKVADLVATDNGGGVKWYATATSNTALSSTDGLVNGREYFADNALGTCSTRQAVTVRIYGAPFGQSFQGACVDHPEEATIADLFAIGNDLQWYNVPTGGDPLDLDTILDDSTIYYVDQANPDTGCRTSRLSVYVTVGVIPVPTGDALQVFCGDSQPTVGDLVVSGNVKWYSTLSSRSPLPLSTPLVDGQSYYATAADPPCESLERLEITVEIVAPNNPGGNSEMEICDSGLDSINTLDLFDALLGSPDTTGTWAGPLPTANGNRGTVDVTAMNAAASPYIFSYSVSSEICPTNTATVSIYIIEGPNPGENGSLILCNNGPAQNLFDSLQGTPDPGGIWSPALSSGTGIFDPVMDAPGTYTYTVQGVPPCGDVSATVEVTINPAANPGTDGTLTLCYDSTPTDLFNSLGGSPQSGGNWSPALASGTGIFDPSRDAPGTYIYSVSGDAPCGIVTASVTVTTTTSPNPGTNASLILCSNDAPINLFEQLGGTPETGGVWSPQLASGTDTFDPTQDVAGIYTYTLQGPSPCGPVSATVHVTVYPKAEPGTHGNLILCFDSASENLFDSLGGTPEAGGIWTPALTSGTGIFDPSRDAEGVYTYTVSGTSPCGDASSTVTVTVNPPADAGSNASLLLCSNDAPRDLFDSLGGTPETGGVWSPALASGTSIFDPSKDAAGIYTYTVQGITPCADASATVEVTVSPASEPGTNGTLTLCVESAPEDLFSSLGGIPQTGGTWSPALASGTSIFDPSQDAPGVYTYTIAGISPCGNAASTVTVNVNPLPNAGADAKLILCSHDSPQDLFNSLGDNPDTGGVWSPALASGTGVFDPSQDAAGIYSYTVDGILPCGQDSAAVEVIINPGVEPGISGSLSLCMNSAPQDLFDSLGGSPQTGGTWSPALSSGTGIFDPTKDAEGVYTYTIVGIPPCGDATATVTVTISELSDAGSNGNLTLCSTDNSHNLFNSLGGTPKPGGVWLPALTSGTGIFDPAHDAAGIYTYTVQGTSPCGEASATVEVTINSEADPGTDGSLLICIESAPQDLFNSLGGTPELGGSWSPALASGTGFFDPTQDAAGIYTYTVSGAQPCGNVTSTVSVTIDPLPDAGSSGRLALCTNDAPQDLFERLGGTPYAGGTWSPALASGTGLFDPAQDPAGSYAYTVTNACGVDTATVVVALIPQPDMTGLTLRADTICLEDAIDINLSGANQLDDGTYSLNYALSGANITDKTISVTITNGSTVINVPAMELTNVGTTTFTILNLLDPVTNCGTASSNNPTVDFNIEQAPTPQLSTDGNSFCIDDVPTIADLTSNILNAENITWYDALEDGNPYPEDTPLVDGNTYYASNISDNGCTTGIRLAVTVSIDSCDPLEIIIPDGFSPNGDNINDDFLIKNLRELYPNFKLQIYNRYGNILYKGDANTPNWDGRSTQGREVGNGILPVGVYFYILELKDTNNKTIQGRVYLSR